jgi:hypothetical protein
MNKEEADTSIKIRLIFQMSINNISIFSLPTPTKPWNMHFAYEIKSTVPILQTNRNIWRFHLPQTYRILLNVPRNSFFTRLPSNTFIDMLYIDGTICWYQRFASTDGLLGARDNKWPLTDNNVSTSLQIRWNLNNICFGISNYTNVMVAGNL